MSHLEGIADDDRHDDTINSNRFTEYNAHQILCTDSRGLDTTAEYARSCCQYAPATRTTIHCRHSQQYRRFSTELHHPLSQSTHLSLTHSNKHCTDHTANDLTITTIRCKLPLSSDRQHLSYGDCLEVRGEIIRTVLCCIVY